ncbi:twitching motility protein PilT [Marinilabiliaceae bacterium JC017]|nr:twitching motility protein PilT [Marinilabiliaceae bacterium JC017]
MPSVIHIRFYEELNDFLPVAKRKTTFTYKFFGKPTIKHIIESLGVPHTEVDLILINDESVDFDYHPAHNNRIAVYPSFETFDISPINKLRPHPLRNTQFILDVHLGKLARYLRLLGFDTIYTNKLEDDEIMETALREHRIILTRDLGILKHGKVTHGYFIRHTNPFEQLKEVINKFELTNKLTPFTRCTKCNGQLQSVDKDEIAHLLLPQTRSFFSHFYQCQTCKTIYWEGSHYNNMKNWLITHFE